MGVGAALKLPSQTPKTKNAGLKPAFFVLYMVRPERFELPTPWFVAKYSIQLSYGRMELQQ